MIQTAGYRVQALATVLGKFAEIDLHPDHVSNLEMGCLYEELTRRFSELSNETAGEHFTPRKVIRLMVNLLFIEDDDILSKPGAKATLYDPEDPDDQGDQHPSERFDYLLANPPFGVEWKKVADSVKAEHESLGFAGATQTIPCLSFVPRW